MKKKWFTLQFLQEKKQKLLQTTRWMMLFIVFINCTFSALALSQEKKVSLNLEEVSAEKLFREIQRQTQYSFVFSEKQSEKLSKISIRVSNKSLNEVLQEILWQRGLDWKFEDNFIIVTDKVPLKEEGNEKIVVSGVVVDVKGDSIPGVTILIKGSTVGTSTDRKGMFKMEIPRNLKSVVLVFSFMGMESREIKITAKQKLRVVMEEKKEKLGEVVVTGYGQVKKNSFTGNTVTVKKEELKKVNNRNIISALQTFDPSFRLRENNEWGSDPNALPEFNIRGNSSFGVDDIQRSGSLSKSELKNNTNLPIFIMDGFEVSVERVYDFDVNRLENVTILKDAAATALYGSRAANGVVVLTTIAPKPGQIRINYNLSGDITAPDLTDYNLMNAAEKLEAEVKGGFYDNDGPLEFNEMYNAKLNNIKKGVDTYWLSKPLHTVFNHKHSLYIEGGSDELRYGVDLKYDMQKGVMKESYRERLGVGIALDYRYKKFQIRNYTSYNVMHAQESPYGTFSDYTSKLPYDEITDRYGNISKNTFGWVHQTNTINPLYEATLHSYDRSDYNELINNLNINWYMFNGFQVKVDFSVDKKEAHDDSFTDPDSRVFDQSGSGFHNDLKSKGELRLGEENSTNWNLNVLMNYTQKLGEHDVNFSLGLNAINRTSTSKSELYRGFPNGILNKPSYAYQIVEKPDNGEDASRLFGCFGTLNYTYKNIYLADVSVRTDGSSEFGSDQRFAPFWSGGLGLNVHNYGFMENQSLFTLLRIRGSYGSLGKGGFPPFAAITTYEAYSKDWYSTGYGAVLKYLGNPNLKWEKTNTLDIGFELELYNGLFFLKASFYEKKTVDSITDVMIPSNTGFTSYKDNMGKISNRGIELTMRSRIWKTDRLSLILWGNLAHNKNKILEISDNVAAYNKKVEQYYNGLKNTDAESARIITQYVPGGSTTSIFAMYSLGIDPANGQDMFLKKDGTITYDWDPTQLVIAGNKEPDASGNFGINFSYKGFSLFASFMFEFGGQRYNSTLVNQVENVDFFRYNADKRVLTDRWYKPGDIAFLKDIKDRDITTRPTSRFVQNYNVLQLTALNVGYDFEHQLVRKIGLSTLRLTFNMNDVLRWSTVKQERGLSYPFARTVSFSLSTSL